MYPQRARTYWSDHGRSSVSLTNAGKDMVGFCRKLRPVLGASVENRTSDSPLDVYRGNEI